MITYDGDRAANGFNGAGTFVPYRQPPGQNPNEALTSSSWLQCGQGNCDKDTMIRGLLDRFDEGELVGLTDVLLDRGLITHAQNGELPLDQMEHDLLLGMMADDCTNPNDAARQALPMSANGAGMHAIQGAQAAATPALPAAPGNFSGTATSSLDAQFTYPMQSGSTGPATLQLNTSLPVAAFTPASSSPPPPPLHAPTAPLGAAAGASTSMGAAPKDGLAAALSEVTGSKAAFAPPVAEEQHNAASKDPDVAHLSQSELELLAKEAIWTRKACAQRAFLEQQQLANALSQIQSAGMAEAFAEQAAVQALMQQASAAAAFPTPSAEAISALLAAPQSQTTPQASASTAVQVAAAQPSQPPGVFSKVTSPPLAQALEVGPLGSPAAISAAAAAAQTLPMSITEVPALEAEPASSTSPEASAAASESTTAPARDSDGRATAAVVIDENSATTLILRNLPPHFDQAQTMAWVDDKGFSGLYDFCLWFPAKATSRLNSCGYAFVNFRTSGHAKKFRQAAHLARIPPPEGKDTDHTQLPVSIAVAKVQGFNSNFLRFQHLLEGTTPTRCQPYFAQDSVDGVTEDDLAEAAEQGGNQTAGSAPVHDGPATTLVIRNLPPTIENQDMAREWLDQNGYARRYDFFLYLPAKRIRRDKQSRNPSAQLHGYGYAFVNFKSAEDAAACLKELNGATIMEEDPVLNVVAAKIQGTDRCQAHFSSLAESGRCTPWVDRQAPPPRRNPSQYQ
mmetsp:Transcript_103444/g.194587  ORF Transcript_103444/g.194587 Transcript_103444/m.194587 type:complete len:738 (+) Transcript_103444:153-2366(+)